MKYTVAWTEHAESQLVEIWLTATERQAVTAAVDRIDAILRIDAHEAGESREQGLRILHCPPMGISFIVHEADRIAKVLEIWLFDDRRS